MKYFFSNFLSVFYLVIIKCFSSFIFSDECFLEFFIVHILSNSKISYMLRKFTCLQWAWHLFERKLPLRFIFLWHELRKWLIAFNKFK